ncbi:4 -phosphopantetheinyl transferase [Micractinium conductrix]|uniref:Small ribosomal subunit protein mS38 n=1 Tax=Micractinium conductrix TaxID=554055 RepID=A0A2P6V6Q0_9CHLO|nr:4 -phosphopantetheinyl transferase [Micractinium conductrix]|eukprot:PSC69764.1 4 -phosphopantetheinyl transferase [Micractinium conductrix]
MQGLRSGLRRLGASLGRGLSSLAPEAQGASAARWGPPLLRGLACMQPAAASFAWQPAAAAALWHQPAASLSQVLAAAAAAAQQPSPAAGVARGLWAPQQGEVLEWRADSVRRKRKRAMNKHKHRKRRKLNRMRK